jgi:hypothetical protein
MAADSSARSGFLDKPWAFWAMLATATAVGAALRLYRLGEPSFWVDEFFTVARSGTQYLPWTHFVGYLPTKLSLWLHGADLGRISLENIADWPSLGVSERAARLGACWVGIATVPILGLLARSVAGGGVAGALALLLAITPWNLYWAQMARFYTVKFLFSSLFILLFARGMQTGRIGYFAVAAAAAILAYLSHTTAIFVVGACIAVVGLAWIARVSLPHLTAGLITLALTVGACGLLLLVKESAPLENFARSDWDPPLRTLILGTVLRIEPATFVAGLAWMVVALRRRDPLGILVSAVAVLVPVGVLALKPFFPIAPRYYFPCLFAWVLLAALWAVEIDRRLSASAGRLAGLSGLGVLLVAVGFNTYLYCRDGTGARARWREACTYVLEYGNPSDPVFTSGGGFEPTYYLGRENFRLSAITDVASLAPGSWVIQRSSGTQPPGYGRLLEIKARYEIPSKPWSWVLYVMRVPPSGASTPPPQGRSR